MTTPPTREQQERLDELFQLLDGTESPDDCYAILKSAWQAGYESADAALRQKVEQLNRDCTAYRDGAIRCGTQLNQTIDNLKQQLAEAQAIIAQRDYELQERAKDCAEHSYDLAKVTRDLREARATCYTFATYIKSGVDTCWAGPNPTKTEQEAIEWLKERRKNG